MYYYLYDSETKAYLGCRWSDTPLTNATTISPFEAHQQFRFNGHQWVPDHLNKDEQQLATNALQQAQFQVSQQKLNSQLALQLAQTTVKEAQNV